MHCQIRPFAQAKIQYSTEFFNRIGRKQTSLIKLPIATAFKASSLGLQGDVWFWANTGRLSILVRTTNGRRLWITRIKNLPPKGGCASAVWLSSCDCWM